jgi:hypothetical protein
MSKLDLNALSDAELEALSTGNIASLSDQTLKMLAGEKPEAPSTGAVMAEAARKGVASFAGTTSGLANLLFSALERYRINPLTEGMRASGGTVAPAPTTGGVVETFQAGRQPVYKSVMETSRWNAEDCSRRYRSSYLPI